MSNVEKSIEVDVPVSTAYNQWTQFEEFPRFMEGVEQVRQMGDDTLHWKADIGGVEREWTARITEQLPDTRVAWTSEDGAFTAGVVTFHKLTDTSCKVMCQMEFEPEGFTEKAADALGIVGARVQGDLKNFKRFIEERGTETGAWRGEIDQKQTQTTRRT